jgi:hypothetical protein
MTGIDVNAGKYNIKTGLKETEDGRGVRGERGTKET